MDKEKINKLLAGTRENIDKTVSFLKSLQRKEIIPVSSGIDHLDTIGLGGLLVDTCIIICARSGNGKSFTINKIRNSILKNKDSSIGVLLWNLEMPLFTLLMVELKKLLKKPLKWIISNEPSKEEQPYYDQVVEEFRDERLVKIDETVTPDDFYTVTKEYIERNKHRKQLFIMIDHIGIIKGKNKTEAISETMEYTNRLKLEYPRLLTFIVLNQLNREIESRWKQRETNPMFLVPTSSDIANSDTCLYFGDIVMAQVIPQVVGLGEKYASIYKNKNEHLTPHYIEDINPTSDTVRLKGNNRIYYHYLKTRLPDGEATVYCEILNPDEEEEIKVQTEFEKNIDENLDF